MTIRILGIGLAAGTMILAAACGGDYGDSSTAPPSTQSPPEGADAAAPSPVSVQVADSPLGEILVDGDGNTLYAFTEDTDGVSSCTDACAATWPAHLVEGEPAPADGLDPAVFTTVEGVDGGTQLKAGEWPLYRFSGDAGPGDVNGQGSGGVWFVVAPDGSLVEDAVASAPSEDASEDDADEGGWSY